MVNKHKQVVCDQTKIILEYEGIFLPSYLEVKNGRLLQHDSLDPRPISQLHHQTKYKTIKELGKTKLKDSHFVERSAMDEYIAYNKKKTS